MSRTSIAILGANGQLGSDLVKVFGEEATPLTHRDLDVTDPESLRLLKELKPEVVINTAAYVRVDDAEVEVEEASRVNALGALHVAKVCNEIGAINVYISTDYVFDGVKESSYEEDDVPNPINVYGLSKYTGEIFTRNYATRHYVLRVAGLYGAAGARGKGGNFVDAMLQRAQRGEDISVVEDMFTSTTYTRDVAELLKKFLAVKPEYGLYHMVNEGYCSWYGFTKEIFAILGWEVEVKPIKSSDLARLARRPLFSALKSTKLGNYGLRMRTWQDALKAYLTEGAYLSTDHEGI